MTSTAAGTDGHIGKVPDGPVLENKPLYLNFMTNSFLMIIIYD